jgi:hypothetical protein
LSEAIKGKDSQRPEAEGELSNVKGLLTVSLERTLFRTAVTQAINPKSEILNTYVVYLVCLVYLVYFVLLVDQIDQMDKRNQINQKGFDHWSFVFV